MKDVHNAQTDIGFTRWRPTAPYLSVRSCYLLRDRDGIYGETVQRRIKSLDTEDVFTAPHSAWHYPFVKRVIGSIRWDCLDDVIIFYKSHLRRIPRE